MLKKNVPTFHRLSRAALLAVLAGIPAALPGHILNLIPDRPAQKVREPAAGVLFFGHPFEHEVLDLEPPESLKAIAPGGSAVDLTHRLAAEKVPGAEGKAATQYRFSFEPSERGDHVISAVSKPRFLGDDEGFVKDCAKAVLHVQAERGWERALGDPIEIVPLTRPYGLRPGSAFLAKVLLDGKPLEGEVVEIERANPNPPAKLPEEEFIARTVRTGPGGMIVATLDEPGWWALTVSKARGTIQRDGKELPLTIRATFWVYVGEPLSPEK